MTVCGSLCRILLLLLSRGRQEEAEVAAMVYKTCPECMQISYCASAERIWFCPCCGKDISDQASVKDRRDLFLSRRKKDSGLLHLKRRTV